MRFLCLHGAGTSGEIFEIQSGGLTQALEAKGHEFHFINGRQEAEPEPEIKGVIDPPFYNHYPRDQDPGTDLASAITYTMRIIQQRGPFDAVMGFSQGAALAASLLLTHAKQHPASPPLFKAAVFICGAAPYNDNGVGILERGEGDAFPITIPTASIVGKQDSLYPWSMRLHGLCEPRKAEFYDHGSRHLVPFDLKNTEAMLGVIERTIERAERGE